MALRCPLYGSYIAEHMPMASIRVSVCGGLISALILSTLMGNILALPYQICSPTQMQSYGWRIPFVLASIGYAICGAVTNQAWRNPLWLMVSLKIAWLNVCRYAELLSNTVMVRWWRWVCLGFTASVYLTIYLLYRFGYQFLMSIPVWWWYPMEWVLSLVDGALTYGYFADRFNSGRVFTLGCIF